MEKTNLLCFCLPTCSVDDMFNYLLPSLKNIGKLKEYCSFSITFQFPYSEEEIQEVLNEFNNLNLEYKYEFKEYKFNKGETPLIQMRNDCALRYPEALFYALLDDDMEFLEGIDKQYLNLIELMLENRNLSVANLFPYDDNQPDIDSGITYNDFENAKYFTSSGIIYRGGIYYGFKGLLPEDMLGYVGGRQDVLTAIWRILQGDSSIKLDNGHCRHYENRVTPGHTEYNWLKSNFEIPTCTSWLESQGYIAHILHFFKKENQFYNNFSKRKCEELYEKGCNSSQTDYIERLRYNLYDLDKVIPLINSYLEKEEVAC